MIKRYTFLLVFLLPAFHAVRAQALIDALEYFIDTDPGVGLATAVSITSGPLVSKNFTVSTASLGAGFHRLYVRGRFADGRWGLTEERTFYVTQPTTNPTPNITALEYFIDTDPGVGNGTPVATTPGASTTTVFAIPTASLSPGFHRLYARGRFADGRWGLVEERTFYLTQPATNPTPDITALEYFIDTDPGVGNGTPVATTPGTSTNKVFDLPTASLSAGFHRLYIRGRFADGRWGLTEERTFYLSPTANYGLPQNIVAAEAFFDTDPGVGNGIPVALGSPAQSINTTASIIVPALALGQHILYLRAKFADGRWSLVDRDTIEAFNGLTCFADTDGDGFGDAANSQTFGIACGAGFVADSTDCDDTNAAIHPGAAESCNNNLDDDCDGLIDESGLAASAGANTSLCPGSTTTLVATPAGLTYEWSTGATTQSIDVSPAAATTYSVTVTDPTNCTASAGATVSIWNNPISATPAPPLCANAPVTLSLAYPLTSGQWSTGETTPAITASLPQDSTFTVIGTDVNGCDVNLSFTVQIYENQQIGAFGSRMPLDSSINVLPQPVAFTWSPVAHADRYDLFVWPSNEARPASPNLSNIQGFNAAEYLQYAQSYHWQLRAKNACVEKWSDTLSFQSAVLPDLTLSSLMAPATSDYGQTIAARWVVENVGLAGTGVETWVDRVWLSVDTIVGGSDTLLGSFSNISYLNPGDTYTQNRSIHLPPGAFGVYYLLVETGWSGTLQESDKTNNVKHGPLTITVPLLPDLQTGTVGGPTAAFGGDMIAVTWPVKNNGSKSISRNWQDYIYLSPDSIFSQSNATLLGAPDFNQLPPLNLMPDSTYTATTSVRLPYPVYGTRWIHVVADGANQEFELSENNNTGGTGQPIQISLLPPPDLEPFSMSIPATAASGKNFTVNFTVNNNGAANYPGQSAWIDNIYISTAPAFDTSAIPIGQNLHFNGIPAGGNYSDAAIGAIPNGISGDYYVYMKTDAGNNVFEYTFEGNNVYRSAETMAITLTPYPDIVVTSIVPSAQTLTEQQPFTLSWATTNQGIAGTNKAFREAVYMSPSPTWANGVGAISLGVIQRSDILAPGDTASRSVTLNMPNVNGTSWYFYIRTDVQDDLYEYTFENNNITRSAGAVTVVQQYADLEIVQFNAPASGNSGTAITATWQVKNNGQAPTGTDIWGDHFFLSTDAALSGNDILVGYRERLGSLGVDSAYLASSTLTLPNGLSGNYYLLLDVAHARAGAVNDNNDTNDFATLPITISRPASPDLVVTQLSLASPLYAGQSAYAHFTVKNMGDGMLAGQQISDRVFFSNAPSVHGATAIGSSFKPRTLAPGELYTDSALLTIPPYANGFYYLLLRTDNANAVYEYNGENNNVYGGPGTTTVFQVLPLAAFSGNLTVTQVMAPDSALLGDSTTIQFQIKNIGDTTVQGNLRNASYVSRDLSFDGAIDRLQGIENIDVSLAPGDSVLRSIKAPLLSDSAGHYHALARTNILASAQENSFDDNLAFRNDSIFIDARPLTLEVPEVTALHIGDHDYYKFTVGAGLDVLITLRNLDNAPNNGHVFAGYEKVPTAAAYDFIDDGADGTRLLLIPNCQAGTYYVLAQVKAPFAEMPNTEILVRTLPFSILSVSPNRVGQGEVTTTVIGAGFRDTTVVELKQGSTTAATGIIVQRFNSMKMDVHWDLTGVPVGGYNLVAVNPDGMATLLGGVTVEVAEPLRWVVIPNVPPKMRQGVAYNWSISFRNEGNIDIPVAEAHIYSTSELITGNFQKTGNIFTRVELLGEAFPNTQPVDVQAGSLHIPIMMKNVKPGEHGLISFLAKTGVIGSIPFNVEMLPYTKIQFIRKQAFLIESQRQEIQNNIALYSQNAELLALSSDMTMYREEMLRVWTYLGFINDLDITSTNFDNTLVKFDPGSSPGTAHYSNTTFGPKDVYLWETNLPFGEAGKNPGWDLIRVAGQIDVTATSAERFKIYVVPRNPCSDTLDHLTTWEPWHDYQWPVAIADGGFFGFDTNKVQLNIEFFEMKNDLCGGTFEVALSGDTLYLKFRHRPRLAGEHGCDGGPGLCGYPGGNGGPGGDGTTNLPGGSGGNGGHGGIGHPGTLDGNIGGGPGSDGGTGGPGGSGGSDGTGGDGGSGGNGGPGFGSSGGGNGGPGGPGGPGGTGGNGGTGGSGGQGGFTGFGGTGGNGGPGGSGNSGPNGNAGASGIPGTSAPHRNVNDPDSDGLENDVDADDDNDGTSDNDEDRTCRKIVEETPCTCKKVIKLIKCGVSLATCVIGLTGCEAATAGVGTSVCWAWAGTQCLLAGTDCQNTASDPCGDGDVGANCFGSVLDGGLKVREIILLGGKLTKLSLNALSVVSDCVPFENWICSPIEVRIPCDPNEILGPSGYDTTARWVSKFDTLHYTVNFENDSTLATATAQRVTVRVPIHANLDSLSVRVGGFGFAGLTFEVPENLPNYTTVLDVTDQLGVLVEVTAGLDIVNNDVFWVFQSIDPNTGLPPYSPDAGMLPINDTLGRGKGFVTYTIKPAATAVTGDTATAQAAIVFDMNDPITTNTWKNTIDALPPTAAIDVLPAVSNSDTIQLIWHGQDDPGGSGLAGANLYYSENGGPFQLLRANWTDSVYTFYSPPCAAYGFFAQGIDHVGNTETLQDTAEALINIQAQSSATLITQLTCYLNEVGITGDTLINQFGCDSIVILHRLPDTLPPVVLTRNIPLQLDPSGHATLAPEDLDDGSTDDCSFSLALSRTDFVCADTGQQNVWLIATDALGHQDSAAATVTVLPSAACQNTIAIANTGGGAYPLPCTCAGNGNFHEEVVVSSAPGKTWVVVTTTLVNPGTSLPYPPGTPLPETPAGSGQYALAGLHAGGVGYSIEVSSPQYPGQTFTLSNTCYYPTPAITGLADLYCTGATPVTLSGSGGAGVVGTGAFTIDNNPATLFNATALGEGNHVVTYTFDAGAAGVLDPLDPGCTASVAQTVRVIYAGQPPVPCQTVVLGNITRKSATAPADSLKNAIVSLAGGSTFKDTTLVNGNYALVSGVSGNFTVTPVKNGDFINGVSTADATRIQQHIANSLPFSDAYSRIAADVNKSNSITSLDAILINQAILGNPAALTQLSTSWRFVPKSYTFPNPSSPWGFPEKITLTGVSGLVSGQDFHAVKLGDVVTAFANPALLPGDIPPPLVWTVPDRPFEAGETWEAEFRVNNFDDIAAYQFMLKTDPAVLRLDAVLPATVLPLTHDNFGAWNSKNGELRTAWSAAQGLTVPGGPVVFRLQFTALQSGGKLSNVLSLDQETLAPEAYTTKLVVTPVELSFTDPETSVSTATNGETDRFILFQNRPNPASRWTVIGFHFPDACDAVLRVSDAAGRQVALRSAFYPAGYSEVLLRLDEILPAGVYFYELVTPFGTRARRMVWGAK